MERIQCNQSSPGWLTELLKGWCLTKGFTEVSTATLLSIQQSQCLLQIQWEAVPVGPRRIYQACYYGYSFHYNKALEGGKPLRRNRRQLGDIFTYLQICMSWLCHLNVFLVQDLFHEAHVSLSFWFWYHGMCYNLYHFLWNLGPIRHFAKDQRPSC